MILEEKQVGQYVKEDFRSAHIFSKHGIDFCCGGRKSLSEACENAAADKETVLSELADLEKIGEPKVLAEKLQTGELIEYIIRTHHSFTREKGNLLLLYTEKMVNAHGSIHNEVNELRTLVKTLVDDLFIHLLKEENVLFPAIKAIIENTPLQFEKTQIAHPIQAMEHEHEEAGAILKKIAELTNNFSPPAYACTTWKICYSTLDEYVKDLHTHIHLENNVLFPEVINLIKN